MNDDSHLSSTEAPPRRAQTTDLAGDAVGMFISAAIFGFFGFFYFGAQQTILLFQIVLWTLRGSAIGFALAGALTLARMRIGPMVFQVIAAISSIMLIVTGIWHFVDPTVANLNGVLLLLFGIWNGASVFRAFKSQRPR